MLQKHKHQRSILHIYGPELLTGAFGASLGLWAPDILHQLGIRLIQAENWLPVSTSLTYCAILYLQATRLLFPKKGDDSFLVEWPDYAKFRMVVCLATVIGAAAGLAIAGIFLIKDAFSPSTLAASVGTFSAIAVLELIQLRFANIVMRAVVAGER